MAIHIQLLDSIIAIIRTRRGKSLSLVLSSMLVILLVLPVVINYSTRKWLNENGADDVIIEDVNFNLFSGRLEFINVKITVANDYTLTLKDAWVNVDWLPLFNKTFHVKEVFIEDTDITIAQEANGKIVVGGISPAANKAKESDSEKKSKPWNIGLEKLTILNSQVMYRRNNLALDLDIDKAELIGLDSQSSNPATLNLRGSLNKAPLTLDVSLRPFKKLASGSARVKLQTLPLTTFNQLLNQQIDNLAGKVSIDVGIDVKHDKDSNLVINKEGDITLADLDLSKAESQAKVAKFNWKGNGIVTIRPGKAANFDLSGKIDASEIKLVNLDNDAELLKTEKLSINKLEASQSTLNIGEIKLSTVFLNIKRNKQGAIVLPNMETSTPPQEASQPVNPESFT